MTSLNKWFKIKKIITIGGKGSSSSIEHQKQREEVAKKWEDDTQKLVEEAEKLLDEEAQMEKEE